MHNPPQILIVKLSSLGDLFHALPTVHALKEGLNAQIDWVTQPEYAELVRHFTTVKNVLVFPRKQLRKKGLSFLKELRTNKYDYVIDLQGLLKSAAIVAVAHGEKKIAPSYAREGAHLLCHATAGTKNRERHAIEQALDVVSFLNLPRPELPISSVTFPPLTLTGNGIHIALCPVSRAMGKNWPPERFVQVARHLQQEFDATLHVVGSPSEQSLCEQMAEAIGAKAYNHAGKTSLIELGSLLREMDLLITVDSGPMHMAAAIGTPTLALFGPTAPLRTGPYGPQHRVIESTFNTGDKKISKKTRQRDMRYIEAIGTEAVIEAAKKMIST